jgi:IMP dehydrogenase
LGREARRGYHLDEIALVPTRRTRGSSVVSTTWQIDAHSFDLPLVAAPSDAVVSPSAAAQIEHLGGLAVLNGEGLWARFEDPSAAYAEITAPQGCTTAQLQRIYSRPVSDDLLMQRVGELRSAGVRVAIRLSPQKTVAYAPAVLKAGADLLVIQGTVISAEHVASANAADAALNLKTFISDLDIPVIVGGCTNYQTALHLMRTGAAGVIVGYGAHTGSATHLALGIDVPMATAIADAAAARRAYLDETGGRYVHLIAYGDMATGGDIAKAIVCGADSVMLGESLAAAAEAPGNGLYWDATVSHPRLPRSGLVNLGFGDEDRPTLKEVLVGPTSDPTGERNLFGGLSRVMAKCGYSSVKEFQKAELIVTSGR